MQLTRYDPFDDLRRMSEDFDKLWRNRANFLPVMSDGAALDLYEENGDMIAEINLPHFKKDEIKITTGDGFIEITAEHKEKEEGKEKKRYFIRESSNQFLRRVSLPNGVNADKAKADFSDGVLKITMPTEKVKSVKTISLK